MGTFHRSRTNDTVVVPKELDKKYQADPEWEPVKESARRAAEQKETAK